MLHGKEYHLHVFHHVVKATFTIWRGQLFHRRVKGQGLKPSLMSMCCTSLMQAVYVQIWANI